MCLESVLGVSFGAILQARHQRIPVALWRPPLNPTNPTKCPLLPMATGHLRVSSRVDRILAGEYLALPHLADEPSRLRAVVFFFLIGSLWRCLFFGGSTLELQVRFVTMPTMPSLLFFVCVPNPNGNCGPLAILCCVFVLASTASKPPPQIER